MTRADIESATRSAREQGGALRRPSPELEAKSRALSLRVAEIREEWRRKAADGDAQAKRLLRECYPEETAAVEEAARVLTTKAKHWAEREPGED
jgi:hypothetical protein